MTTDRFADRRAALLAQLGETVAIVPAGREQTRNDDVAHPFRQDSDFHFLTGFAEPDAVAVLDAASDEPFTLFVRPRDPEKEAWNGLRAGVEGAMTRFGADAAFELDELDELDDWLRRRLAGRRSIGYTLGGRLDPAVRRALGSV